MLTRAPADAPHRAAVRSLLLLLAFGAAMSLRVSLGGGDPAASLPAAVVFAAALALVALAAGARISRPSLRWAAAGLLGGALLFGVWWWSEAAWLELRAPSGQLLVWSAVVTAVAVAEELALRGALFAAVLRSAGPVAALLVSSVVFALLHVPLYGWQALPVDCAAGLFLGGLRLLSGGVAAPAVAHAVADLAAGWLG